jgi:hypothetical protein
MTPCIDYRAGRLVLKILKYIIKLLRTVSVVGLINELNETEEGEDPYRRRALSNTVTLKCQQMQKLSGEIHLEFK